MRKRDMRHIVNRPWLFTGMFILVFFLSATFLYIIDFVPEPVSETLVSDDAAEVTVAEEPVRIVIDAINVDTPIENPQELSIEALDQALLSGAVRYPGSALLGEEGTLFLFGHQSYLPVVRNQAFKAFNDLQRLEAGDTISVFSETAEHQYRVVSVSKALADDALIPLEIGEKKLFLSTCNSFGDPGERYIVEAEYMGRIVL